MQPDSPQNLGDVIDANTPLRTAPVNPDRVAGALAQYKDGVAGSIQVKFATEIGTADLVAIAVAEAEKRIRERVAQLRTALEKAQEDLTLVNKSIDSYLKNWATSAAETDSPLQALVAELKKVFPRFDPSYSVSEFHERKGLMAAQVSFQASNEDGSFNMTRKLTGKPAEAFLADRKKSEEAAKTVEDAKRTLMNARSALNNVDGLERQAKAAFAQNVAEQTEQGKALVAAIKSTVSADDLVNMLMG